MDRWISGSEQMLNLVLGSPVTATEQAVIAVLAFLALVVVVNRAGSAFGIPNTGVAHSVIVSIMGIGLSLLAMVAAMFYVPQWNDAALRIWILSGAVVVAGLVLVVPLMCALQKAGYIAGLLTWLVSVGAAALVILMVGAAFNAFSAGERNAQKGGLHKLEVKEVLDQ